MAGFHHPRLCPHVQAPHFAISQENYENELNFTTDILSHMVRDVGYELSIKRQKENLLFAHNLLVASLERKYRSSALASIEKDALHMAQWVEGLWEMLPEAQVISLVNRINSREHEGYEIVIGRWTDATNSSITFLTEFRYKDQCSAGICGSDPTAAAPMKAALSPATGALWGMDYRPRSVAAGYTYLPFANAGLVYKIDKTKLVKNFVEEVRLDIDQANSQEQHSTELVLGAMGEDGKVYNISQLRFCETGCGSVAWEGTVLDQALHGRSGHTLGKDYRGLPVVAAYGPFSDLGVALVLKIDLAEIVSDLQTGLADSLDKLNRELHYSEEMVLVTSANASGVAVLTEPKFGAQCDGPCAYDPAAAPFLDRAATQCQRGVGAGRDYRGAAVVAAYRCIPELSVGLLMKVDRLQIRNDQIEMARRYADSQNNRSAGTTMEIVLAQRNAGVGAADVEGPEHFTFLTQFKHRDACRDGRCGGEGASAEPMVRALQGLTGTVAGNDYRPREVLAVHSYVAELDVGMVLKVDMEQVMAPAVEAAVLLVLISILAVVVLMTVLAVVTRLIWRRVEEGWYAFVRRRCIGRAEPRG